MNGGGVAPSIHSPWSHVSRVSNYGFGHPSLPRGHSCAKAWSTTTKFLNLCKIICIQVSKHTSALKAHEVTTPYCNHGGSNGNQEKVKTVLGHLRSMLYPDRRGPEPRSKAPWRAEGVRRSACIATQEQACKQVKRKLKICVIKASICLIWSLCPVIGIAAGVRYPSNVLLFQGTVLAMAESDFLTESVSVMTTRKVTSCRKVTRPAQSD